MAELIKIYPENPNPKELKRVVEALKDGGLVVVPTDTVYGISCDLKKPRAIEQVARIKGEKPEKANLSLICYDLSHLSDFSRSLPNHVFKLMKQTLPGPFTFILNANNNVPKIFKGNKKTIGIRVPANEITREIVKMLGNPLAITSVHHDDEILEYITDPGLICEKYDHLVDIVVDAGIGMIEASTILDCTGDDVVLTRQGLGNVEAFLETQN